MESAASQATKQQYNNWNTALTLIYRFWHSPCWFLGSPIGWAIRHSGWAPPLTGMAGGGGDNAWWAWQVLQEEGVLWHTKLLWFEPNFGACWTAWGKTGALRAIKVKRVNHSVKKNCFKLQAVPKDSLLVDGEGREENLPQGCLFEFLVRLWCRATRPPFSFSFKEIVFSIYTFFLASFQFCALKLNVKSLVLMRTQWDELLSFHPWGPRARRRNPALRGGMGWDLRSILGWGPQLS